MDNQKKAYLYAIPAVVFWSTVATAFKIALNSINFFQLLFYIFYYQITYCIRNHRI